MSQKFDPKELEIIGTFHEGYSHVFQFAKYNTPISCRENYLRMLRGEKPMWMPIHQENLYFGPNIFPDIVARGIAGSYDAEELDLTKAGGYDMFGVDWVYEPRVRGSMPRPGFVKVPDWEHWEDYVTFPNVQEWDWAGSAERNKAFLSQDLAVSLAIHNGLTERLVAMSDMSSAMMALIDEDAKPAIHRFFDKLCGVYEEMIVTAKKWYNIDMIWIHDDWGTQLSSMFSIDTCREMVVPYLKRVVDCAHSNGLFVELHSCGKIEHLVPCMIEAGIDAWRGQKVILDKADIFDKYGDKIILGIEPTTLPADTTDFEQLEKDCRAFVDRYAKSGRVYCGMMGVPPKAREYIYAMSREALAE